MAARCCRFRAAPCAGIADTHTHTHTHTHTPNSQQPERHHKHRNRSPTDPTSATHFDVRLQRRRLEQRRHHHAQVGQELGAQGLAEARARLLVGVVGAGRWVAVGRLGWLSTHNSESKVRCCGGLIQLHGSKQQQSQTPSPNPANNSPPTKTYTHVHAHTHTHTHAHARTHVRTHLQHVGAGGVIWVHLRPLQLLQERHNVLRVPPEALAPHRHADQADALERLGAQEAMLLLSGVCV